MFIVRQFMLDMVVSVCLCVLGGGHGGGVDWTMVCANTFVVRKIDYHGIPRSRAASCNNLRYSRKQGKSIVP